MGKSNGHKATPEEVKKSISRLFHYSVKYYPFEFWFSIFCILFSGITGVIPTLYIGIVIDEIDALVKGETAVYVQTFNSWINDVSLSLIGTQILIISVVLIFGLVASYFYNFLEARLAQGVQKRIRDELFNHMQDLPLSYFDTRTRGDIMSIYTNDVDTLREAMSRSWPTIVSGRGQHHRGGDFHVHLQLGHGLDGSCDYDSDAFHQPKA
jgi:ATP-binding cassette subfamily B protein